MIQTGFKENITRSILFIYLFWGIVIKIQFLRIGVPKLSFSLELNLILMKAN